MVISQYLVRQIDRTLSDHQLRKTTKNLKECTTKGFQGIYNDFNVIFPIIAFPYVYP